MKIWEKNRRVTVARVRSALSQKHCWRHSTVVAGEATAVGAGAEAGEVAGAPRVLAGEGEGQQKQLPAHLASRASL